MKQEGNKRASKSVNLVSVKLIKEGSILYEPRRVSSPKDAFDLGKKFLIDLQKRNKVDDEKKEVITKELKQIDSQISNIVTAIASGFMQEEFKAKMDDLKERKSELEFKQAQLKSDEITQIVTEEDARKLLNNFSDYVVSRNIPDVKSLYRTLLKKL